MANEKIEVTSAGEIRVDEVTLIVNAPKGTGTIQTEIDLRAVFAEINLYEDLFSNALYGNILISDSNNLIETLAIFGLEGLRIDVRTPGLSDAQRIYKTFTIYAITEQDTINNDRLQVYRLHFCSSELMVDALSKPLNRALPSKDDNVEATASSLVPFIFKRYFVRLGGNSIPRNLILKDGEPNKDAVSDLVLGAPGYDHTELDNEGGVYFGEDSKTTNKIKFIAPNWTPLKCINWIANRAVPEKKTRGGSFLFYESNKAFHFTSVDSLLKDKSTIETFFYEYSPPNIQNHLVDSEGFSKDVAKDMRRVLKFEYVKAFNVLDQQQNGYFGQEIRSVDTIMKRYREHQYAYDNHYEDFEHTDSYVAKMFPNSPKGLLGKDLATLDPRRHVIRRMRQQYFLFDDELSPLSNHKEWLAQRTTRLSSLTNFAINLFVYGRTDMKVGTMISFLYPNMKNKNAGDKGDDVVDRYLSGVYLVTAIHHFITPIAHKMTMEVMKDAFNKPTGDSPEAPEMHYDP